MATRSKTRAAGDRPAAELPLTTPDGRYIVVRGRLWRTSNPQLSPSERKRLVDALMTARREVGLARRIGDMARETLARAAVDRCKHALGERGAVWWTDGAPDLNWRLVRNRPYAEWFESASTGRCWR